MHVMFIEYGMGLDLHGQDATVAAVRAARDAIGRSSLPGMRLVLPDGDLGRMQVHVKLAVPVAAERVDVERVKQVFPYGQVSVEITPGGMLCTSGIVLTEHGDSEDLVIIVNAAVEVGY
ncbi:Lin0512 family protein [Gloeobacter violaceus]|uniref:Glr0491 protein n=1 Tax=Gloeobacter violaceus (strain ATCC 29082 / PCC 7421) TaxID=251221 RepID=Q7NNC0_GLOVI|nr:Lin0512 family protein [Gloeobacter violaceus]BAC88432.1 glr0491 [Gloeobacter violaceus PCC 7421]